MLNYPSLTSGTEGSGIGRTTTSSRLKSKPPTGQHTTTPSKLGGSLKDAKQRKLEQQVQELRVERDLLRQELDSITRSRHRSPSPVTRSRSLNRFQTRDDYTELTKLRQERDELRSLLNKLEHRVQEIQRNVHTLTQERDQINKLYNDSRSEIHRLHQDLYAMHETGDRNTQTTQTVLRRVESERDRALVDLSRVTAERDSLITKYKNCTENAHADKLRLTNQLDHLENSLNQVAEERDEVIRRVSMHRLRIDELQQRQQQLEDSLAERQELLKKVNEESAQLKQEAELQNNRLEERELQISQMNERTRVMEMDCRRLHERVDEYDMKLRKERDECSLLRNQLQNMEEEKVKLQCDFDNLTCERDDLVKHQRQIEKRAQINLSERDRLSRQVNDLNDLKESLEKQLRQLEKDYSDQTTKYQLEREANEKLQQRIDTAIHNKNSIDRRANWLEQQTEELRSHIDQLQQQLSTQKDENKWMSETNEKLTADNESLRVCDYTLCLLSKNTSTGDLWLIYGCRSPTSSLLFENELSDAVNSKVLKHLCLCFSRDTVNSPDEKYALKEISSILTEQACFPLKAQYVQDCILCKYSTDYEVSEHDIQLMNLVFEKGAKIMICGGPRALAFGVYESWLRLLAMRLYFERTQKWCKYSAIPEEDFINARAYVDIMRKAERFQEDVWA
ncbi:unnamed protein product [Schistosoma mattheei]|nr:unnamed protein product [Schistosoma mattheei]